MVEQLAANTDIVIYLMATVGVLGVFAKIVNQVTLNRLIKAASNMSKSTHKLMKLVRAKYEQSCMIRDSVENTEAFIEKYIYEYRGFLFRIHTWRQIEMQCIWFVGILGAFAASVHFLASGFNESVYRYIAVGLAEMVLLAAVCRLSDEPYKINAVKTYMVDYLENICVFRLRRHRQTDRESIDVIAGETPNGVRELRSRQENENPATAYASGEEFSQTSSQSASSGTVQDFSQAASQRANVSVDSATEDDEESVATGAGLKARRSETSRGHRKSRRETEDIRELPINIEGEPRSVERSAKSGAGRSVREDISEEDRPALREEAIRQILEEFLA